ncbi:ROK family protein [Gracilibacillus sp. HCP3S3_G5_1]|uniref:ROK family protein n=1 Tax=unclassified Gracilibacillus TaxID=2625209 RepID=UPI003F8C109C
MDLYLCFDIGGTNVKYGVLDQNGNFLFQGKFPTRRTRVEEFINDLSNRVTEVMTTHSIKKIGISFPGFIDPITGYAAFAGALDILHGKNIVDLLTAQIDIPIIIENDANCATLAERLSGNAVDCENFICMTIGTGIGGGLVVNGELVHGHTFKAGEFGLMIVNGMKNGYQNMHEIASTSAFIHQYKQLKGLSDREIIEGNEVFQAAEQDKAIQNILDQWFQYVSFGIFNLAATLNPEKILIGGAISVREDLYERLRATLSTIPSWPDIEVEVAPCKHHNNAGMLGALYKCLGEEKL